MRVVVEVVAFAAVGLTASVVHFVTALLLIENWQITAWIANILAFAVALPVSYLGHSHVTFSARRNRRASAVSPQTFGRFLQLAVSGFAINQTSVVLFIETLGLPHRPVLFFTIFGVAGVTFVASKYWAFRGNHGAAP